MKTPAVEVTSVSLGDSQDISFYPRGEVTESRCMLLRGWLLMTYALIGST